MSLIKQLWIGIVVLLLFALGGNFIISTMTAKTYLEEQLRLKNIDNANSLALSMWQMPDKDSASIELLINAQFDAGHYEYIVFKDTNKNPIVARSFEGKNLLEKDTDHSSQAPKWFANIVNFDVAPGIAQVQDDWQQRGTLVVKSHSRYALDALWKNTRDLFNWFVIASLISGLIGSVILKYVSRPLDLVVDQAEAIGSRRFIISKEPRTTEFQRVVKAMNKLSHGVKEMLEKETQKLDFLRQESQTDKVTGLANRVHFLNLFDSLLNRDDFHEQGIILIARVMNLSHLNHELGHQQTDKLLQSIATVFKEMQTTHSNSQSGRLNGSDFSFITTADADIQVISKDVNQRLHTQLSPDTLTNLILPVAICAFNKTEKRNEILHKLDGALAQAEIKGNRALVIIENNPWEDAQQTLVEWRTVIENALTINDISLAKFAVKTTKHELFHHEVAVRLRLDGQFKPAGYFMPWAVRLGIMQEIDLAVLRLALTQLRHSPIKLAINLSAAALCSVNFRTQAITAIKDYKEYASGLAIEFSEVCLLRHIDELKAFATELQQLNCQLGLEHVGLEFTQLTDLQDMGLDYLKIDSAIVRDIHLHANNQTFLRSLCTLGHSLGINMIAEGVVCEEEQQELVRLGIDATTGPFVKD
jgi:diguanylate cyclase (GGDEF)-like protein